jgi:hypothetical protein
MKILGWIVSMLIGVLMLTLAGGVITLIISISVYIAIGLLAVFIIFLIISAICKCFQK